MKKIAVGMSGGVDSSVAALLLREAGMEVIGLTLHLRDHALRRVGLHDAERAAAVAEQLDIPHITIDARAAFEKLIVRPFAEEYARGHTPSPCVCCNPLIKFGLMLDEARRMGCDGVATGHYVRTILQNGNVHLLRGHDPKKDQSYFLHRLTQSMLSRAVFPLGEWTKEQVRELASSRALRFEASAESQDLCFVESGRYIPFVEKYIAGRPGPGIIVDEEGRELGRHAGYYHYTVGQRKGLGLSAGKPCYVKEVRAETNEVVVGFHAALLSPECRLADVSWIEGVPRHGRYQVQIRYRHHPVTAQVEPLPGDAALIRFDEPQFAVAPGQAGVIYDGDEVLGGGWITA